MNPITAEVRLCAERSVLCWLATVSSDGQPNVSPKEIFAVHDDHHLVIAEIASPNTLANLASNSKACCSFVDVFRQRGFKLTGEIEVVPPSDDRFPALTKPLEAMTKGVFPIRHVMLMGVTAVAPILAPSYWMFPETTEEQMIEGGYRLYGVRPV